MRFIPMLDLLLLAPGCASLPAEILSVGEAQEVRWKGTRLTMNLVATNEGLILDLEFWVPGLSWMCMINPFEGSEITLDDGRVVASDAKPPDILSLSGTSCNAWSERVRQEFSFPKTAKPTLLAIRCGLGEIRRRIECD